MIRQVRRASCESLWNAVEKENIVKKDIIHENSNNHNKYINNENSGEKSAEQAGAVLRAMTVDDISAVKQIEQTCFSDAWSEKLLSDLLESEWDEAWVLTDTDGTRIGYANFRFLAGEGELMRIAVLPEYRGCGESKKLMDRLEISAKEKEAPDLTLEVRAGNTPAINLYKSYGFRRLCGKITIRIRWRMPSSCGDVPFHRFPLKIMKISAIL